MSKRKKVKSFLDTSLGFPIRLADITLIDVWGTWVPDVDYNKVEQQALNTLAEKPTRLTGYQVRFIRQHFGMTLQAFAKRLGVTHAAVLKWERCADESCAMTWSIEKDIRLLVAAATCPKESFLAFYERLSEEITEKETAPIGLEGVNLLPLVAADEREASLTAEGPGDYR